MKTFFPGSTLEFALAVVGPDATLGVTHVDVDGLVFAGATITDFGTLAIELLSSTHDAPTGVRLSTGNYLITIPNIDPPLIAGEIVTVAIDGAIDAVAWSQFILDIAIVPATSPGLTSEQATQLTTIFDQVAALYAGGLPESEFLGKEKQTLTAIEIVIGDDYTSDSPRNVFEWPIAPGLADLTGASGDVKILFADEVVLIVALAIVDPNLPLQRIVASIPDEESSKLELAKAYEFQTPLLLANGRKWTPYFGDCATCYRRSDA